MRIRGIEIPFLSISFLGCLVLLLIALNVLQHGPLPLHRFRETTWAVHVALLGWVLVHTRGLRRYAEPLRRISSALGSQRCFVGMMSTMLVLYLLSAITQHLAFRTFSHDFTMIDDALYHSHSGRFMYSSVLQRSFLSEHFSPILLLLVPIHAVVTTPWLLVVVQPVALWASALVLKRILDEQGIPPALRNVALLVYLNHPVTIATLSYLFHMECFLPGCVFAAFLFHQRDKPVGLAVATLLALAIKEDVGIYFVSFGAWMALVQRRWRRGALVAVGSATWTALALSQWLPSFGMAPSGYPFLERWGVWGDGPLSIAAGFLRHPVDLVAALWRDPMPRIFACLGFLPFLRPSAVILFAAPWIVTTTSSNVQQASLSLYYGVPFLSFAVIASTLGLQSNIVRRWRARPWGFVLGWIVVMLNVAHLTYPEIPLDRFKVLEHIHAIPGNASVQAMSCFYPVLDYARSKELLRSDSELHADYVLLRRRGGTWPLSGPDVERMLESARKQSYEAIYLSEGFAILRRGATVGAGHP